MAKPMEDTCRTKIRQLKQKKEIPIIALGLRTEKCTRKRSIA